MGFFLSANKQDPRVPGHEAGEAVLPASLAKCSNKSCLGMILVNAKCSIRFKYERFEKNLKQSRLPAF